MKLRNFLTSAAGLALLVLPMAAPAPVYISFPDIPGEATDPNHKNWIDIESVAASPTGLNTGKPPAGPGKLTLIKRTDKASPQLFQYVANGKHIPSVQFDISAPPGSAEPYLKYVLKDVMISSMQAGGSSSRPSESLSLNFTKIELRSSPLRGSPMRGVPAQEPPPAPGSTAQ